MRIVAVMLLAACSGTPSGTADPEPVAPPAAGGRNAEALLKAGPPVLGPGGRALTKLAGALGVGTVRCPVDGAGRVMQEFGTPRDGLRPVGPPWMLELRPEDIKPWNPTFDLMPVEDRWVTLLADPGSKGSTLRVGDDSLALTWPAAKKGEAVICSAVKPISPRVITGSVDARDVDMWAVGCNEEPDAVAADGTFVIDATPPCTLWLEARDAHRTEKVAIPIGEGKFELEPMTWVADDLQTANRQWTEAGNKRLKAIARKLDDEITYTFETLDKIEGELDGDEKAQKVVQRWRNEMVDWQKMTQRVHAGIEGKVPL